MLMSGTPSPFAGMSRRPSSSTSVRLGPRPLRSRVACPSAIPFDVPVSPGTNCGIRFSAVSAVDEPTWAKTSAGTVTIGLADTKSGREMREPVTMISSRESSCATPSGGSRSAAHAMTGTLVRCIVSPNRAPMCCLSPAVSSHRRGARPFSDRQISTAGTAASQQDARRPAAHVP